MLSANGHVASELVDLIGLHVLCLNGDGCSLSLSPSTLGLELRTMVSEQLPTKKGAKLVLYHLASPLMLQKTLQEQGIEGKTARLSCTYVPTDLYAACKHLQGLQVSDACFALDGVTQIGGCTSVASLRSRPESLQSLTFIGQRLDESLDGVTLPSNLQSLTFGDEFNQSLDGVTLPSNLQSLTFGGAFNQSLEGVTLPSNLQSLTFGDWFNQSLDRVTLPSNLQSLTFGYEFNQSLDRVTLPSNLQSLTFGKRFNQSLDGVTLPSGLHCFGCLSTLVSVS